jgi:hypothetical protein
LATFEAGAKPKKARLLAVFLPPSMQWLHFPTNGSVSDEVSTSGATSFFLASLLAAASFFAADLTASEEEGAATEEALCVRFFFTATDEAGTPFFPDAVPYFFLNPGRAAGTASFFTTATDDDEGVVVEEGANRLVPGSLRQWRFLGLVISKGGELATALVVERRREGVEGGGGDGGEARETKCAADGK